MTKEKQRGTVVDKGKKKITNITGKEQENSCLTVQVLRERNIGVVIRDEQDINLMHLRAVILQAKAGFFVYTLKSLVLIYSLLYPTIMCHQKLCWPNVHDGIRKETKDYVLHRHVKEGNVCDEVLLQ
ncbi:hypothetical protein RHSIM_Rhsim08G0199100 [Rhododendron simsii]|uniref:Uncharacterized protein n=1 Tax=Rhododendron simsii TaxID=118357 RepID=A0A834GNK5_RHOSS|nr:hypothetical protein RHSIM_Rhsim08G0199100 [Rhododendron simsii]